MWWGLQTHGAWLLAWRVLGGVCRSLSRRVAGAPDMTLGRDGWLGRQWTVATGSDPMQTLFAGLDGPVHDGLPQPVHVLIIAVP